MVNGVVYADSNDDNVYAFDLSAGQATPPQPGPGALHPNYRLRPQRQAACPTPAAAPCRRS